MRWAIFIGGWLAGASALATAGPSVVTEALGPNGILSAANMAEDVPLVPADIRDEVSFDYAAVQNRRARRPFESDHEFDGFVQPFSNPIQFKDPRAMTEARGLFIAAWSDPNMPLGDTSAQIYALQLRAALTERLEVFAAKDGIVRLSPGIGASQTGLANLAVGGKYVFYRDPETQTIASAVVQVEAPTGYANIFQNQGSGLLAGYVSYNRKSCSVEGKEKGGVSCCDWFTNSSPRRAERIRHHARLYGSRFELSIRSEACQEAGAAGRYRDGSG